VKSRSTRSGPSSPKKEASCDPLDPLDRLRGDDWDHTAVDPESRLLLALVPGQRDGATCERLVRQVRDRTGGRTDLLITSDEHAPYETSIHEVYGVEQPRPKRPGPGRPPKPVKVVPPELCHATVRKRREKGHVVEVVRTLVFGVLCLLVARLKRSTASTTINTSFVGAEQRDGSTSERAEATQDLRVLEGLGDASSFVGSSDNFCWAVRTLRTRKPGARGRLGRPRWRQG
jgi:hypothetical protein